MLPVCPGIDPKGRAWRHPAALRPAPGQGRAGDRDRRRPPASDPDRRRTFRARCCNCCKAARPPFASMAMIDAKLAPGIPLADGADAVLLRQHALVVLGGEAVFPQAIACAPPLAEFGIPLHFSDHCALSSSRCSVRQSRFSASLRARCSGSSAYRFLCCSLLKATVRLQNPHVRIVRRRPLSTQKPPASRCGKAAREWDRPYCGAVG